MPMRRDLYPHDWELRSRFIRHYRARNQCEWCGAKNGEPHPVTGSRVVLTTAHVFNKQHDQCSLLNLAALCQRCHLNHDRKEHLAKQRENRERRKRQRKLL